MPAASAPSADRALTLAGALPQHLLALVFSSLDEAADLASLRLACREFVAPASSAVRRLRPNRRLPGLGARFPGAETLDLAQLQDAWQEACLDELQEVRDEREGGALAQRCALPPSRQLCLGGPRLQPACLSVCALGPGPRLL